MFERPIRSELTIPGGRGEGEGYNEYNLVEKNVFETCKLITRL